MLKIFVIFYIAIQFIGLNAETLKERRSKKSFDMTVDTVLVEEFDEKINYKIKSRSKDLHRKAIQFFHRGDFKNSEQCFSLALSTWNKSKKLHFDYALCSMLFPEPIRSYNRSRDLINRYVALKNKSDGSEDVLNAILYWQLGNVSATEIVLNKSKALGEWLEVINAMKKNISHEDWLINDKLLMKILPKQLPATQKRELR